MRIKSVPVIGLRDGIPRPVGSLEVFKDDPRVLVFFRSITPHVEIGEVVAGIIDPGPPRTRNRRVPAGITAPGYSGIPRRDCSPRRLKPWALIGSVIDYQLRDHAQPALMRCFEKGLEIP